ncbi:class II aldolase/adducin family protein [Verticiella sediminum]|uniref:Class II aldolase/adducin family protein n=1 Tax=Verticiella sediminum TaxID=1247510 RepID=A0A556A6L7_9BURK|nr:class II aldolase/adducin family protein [Verticiella sediminum]TSH88517.1 class II aldolase/adducin family protein [Verticiella sediminum]
MQIPTDIERPAVTPGGISPAERAMREDLAALYRAVHRYGMTDLIYNHITARVPDEPEHILINPYGLLYQEVCASCLYKISLDGEVRYKPDDGYTLNPAAYVIHTAVHKARHDAVCVLHVHTRASTAVSAMTCGLLPISQQAALFHGRIGYHDFTGPEVTLAQQEGLVADLGAHNVVLLRNHGVLLCAHTIAEAFFNLYWFESACKVQVDAMAAGSLVQFDDAALQATRDAFARVPIRGEREWKAVRRDLDRTAPDYRD